ncbi:hypothetical protein C8F01DRAFT_1363687 [Mycena amicta]|nr:hypothetical protein C8F01DRAFT_1363687 [Mycena amicta]
MTSSGGGGGGTGGYAGAPKYINDFSKALAGEVRVLLAEVGQLRDQRRELQFEIAELMSMKSKHGEGGEYVPEWRPAHHAEEPPPPPPEPPAAPGARPAWRVVNKRRERMLKSHAMRPPSPNSVPPLEPPKPNVPAWAQWRPNTAFAPTPRQATAAAPLPSSYSAPPARSGLFGPPTPPPK